MFVQWEKPLLILKVSVSKLYNVTTGKLVLYD